MRKLILTLASLAAVATALPAAAASRSPEEKLAREIEGRVAGDPVDCINLRNVRSSRIIPGTAIVYDAGSTIYVNRPRGGASSLDSWDVLVTKLHSSQLCSIDTVQLQDSSSRMLSGIVFLGDFVPYRKVKANGTD
ncbi:MAG TPA: hypothetical protein VGB62_04695 [Allosphingosinicella sp.]|jgi:hypothetical protein